MLWLLACSGTPAPQVEAPAAPPDIVVVTIDTLRRDRLGAYGYDRPTSPVIDALAETGTVFERAYAPTGWTAPSMTSLFTGLWPAQHGIERATARDRKAYDQPVLPSEHTTLAEALGAAGYTTFGVATNGHIKKELGLAQGFDHWVEHGFVPDNDPVLSTIDAWRPALDEGGPRFVWLHFMAPHAPYVERAHIEEFARDGADPRSVAYDSEVRFADTGVGQALDRLGFEDPVVVVTSDHGELLGGPHGWGHGGVQEALVRVPMVVSGPGVEAQRVQAAASLIDLAPTLLELAGGSFEGPGVSLAPALAGAELADRDMAVSTRRGAPRDGLVRGTTKATWEPQAMTGSVIDLATDPLEERAGFDAAVLAAFHARYTDMMASPARVEPLPPLGAELSAAELEHLRLLGYVDD